jgi:putative hydrolase of the HAD superfamily
MKPTSIRNLLFDLGNVIIDIDVEGAMGNLRALFKHDAERSVIDHAILQYETGKISTATFIQSFQSQSREETQNEDFIQAWNSMLVTLPKYRLDMLEMLRNNFNVYLLSNTNSLHLEWIHEYLMNTYSVKQFEKTYFDQAYYSHIIGDRKPNASIFQHVISDAILTPERTLFMDDLKDNIDTAAKHGFQTYLVDKEVDIAEYLKVEGYY